MHDLQFDEVSHSYTINGEPAISVTQLVKSYAHEFDADEHAGRVAAKTARSTSDVKAAWAAHGKMASDRGTAVHAATEDLMYQAARGTLSPTTEGGHYGACVRFLCDHLELLGQRNFPEARLCHPAYRVAGTADLICNLDGVPSVVDWKAVRVMEVLGFGSKKMYAPANHLTDSNFWHYTLQLNCYRIILMDYYDIEPAQLVLVHLQSNGTYVRYDAPVMEPLARDMMERGPRKARKTSPCHS